MQKPITVLSLFDGISCGQIALNRANIPIKQYFASEVDKFAIKITQNNYPNTIQLGDIQTIQPSKLPKIDLLIGGSPCQGFSFAGKQLNFNDPRSKLFFNFLKILQECKPKYFLLENVVMKKEYIQVISNYLNINPILINSSLVSAQNRKRLYWTNIPNIGQPTNKGIFLQDIIEDGIALKENGKGVVTYNKKSLVVFCGAMRGRYIVDGKRQDGKMKTAGLTKQRMEVRYDGKTNALTTVQKDNNVLYNLNEKLYYEIDKVKFRNLSPIECERLQTIPDNYTNHVSNTQRYKALGNGWTVDVIAHIFQGIGKTVKSPLLQQLPLL